MATATRNRRIKQTYAIITPESAEIGDYAETGWIDEEGVLIAPDEYDREEHDDGENDDDGEFAATVALAVNEITARGSVEPSASHHHPGVWYTTIDDDIDYRTGERTVHSFHLEGFTADEEKAIHCAIKRANGR